MTKNLLARILAFAGAIPFVVSASLLWLGQTDFFDITSLQNLVSSYGLLILAFMAGTHWGLYLGGVKTSMQLFISSNAVALAGWFAYFLLNPKLFFATLAALFAILLLIDRKLKSEGVLDPHYLTTRSIVSAVVVSSLAVIALKV